MPLTPESSPAELWAEVARLRSARDHARTQRAVLESEAERLREENARLAERAQFVESLSRKARETNEKLEILTSLTRELASFDLDGVLEVCVKRIPFLVGARFASVYLYDAAKQRLVLRHHTHGREIDGEVDLQANPDSLMARAVRSGETLCIGDLETQADLSRPHRARYQTSSCLITPLVAGGEVQGVLNLADRFDQRPFDAGAPLGVIHQACELLAVSLRNAQLFDEIQRAARTDRVTGVINRFAFLETLAIEVKRAQRYGHPLGMLAVHLGGLRLVNANYGHLLGDQLLREGAQALRKSVRDVDVVGRTGGATFGVLLPEQLLPGAQTVAHRLAQTLGRASYRVGEVDLELPATLGLAVLSADESAEAFQQRALEALERARAQGEVICEDPGA
ncbi:MAG: diguanylate cyclase [Planctomycetes bacterium]|nr:diguanylate cyclase [Planctomycetota bacterium]